GTFRLALSLLAAVAFWADRLPAQDTVPAARDVLMTPVDAEQLRLKHVMVPPAQDFMVVPAAPYEPDRPRQPRPASITTVGFNDASPNAPDLDLTKSKKLDGFRFWARAEYLRWRVTDAPIAVPLVTTNT